MRIHSRNAVSALAVLVFAHGCTTRPSGEPAERQAETLLWETEVSANVTAAALSWQDATGIMLDAAAQTAIVGSFEESTFLSGVLEQRDRTEAQWVALVSSVASSYLYELRDKSRIGIEPPRASLRESHVVAFPPSEFLRLIEPVLQEETSPLRVESEPDDAEIWAGGTPKGFTSKEFVVGRGTHRVTVRKPIDKIDCDGSVLIGVAGRCIRCRPGSKAYADCSPPKK